MFIHQLDPIAFSIGPIAIYWYGITYLVGFMLAWLIGCWYVRHRAVPLSQEDVSDLLFYGAIGVILGGRVGYMLFYHYPVYGLLSDPWALFRFREGGMSFHGGLIGVLCAMLYFARQRGLAFFMVSDFVTVLVPLGLGAGRIGNFINGELWGRPTELPWAVIFPQVDWLPRHPSQLYECFFEGVILFALMWWFTRKPRPTMSASGLFAMAYGTLRFYIEYFRAPDSHLGFVLMHRYTMGQLLSLPLIIIGLCLFVTAYRQTICRYRLVKE